MELTDKIRIGEILVDVLDREIAKLDDPFDDELPAFIVRAIGVQSRMKRFSMAHDDPPEMQVSLDKMDAIIKRLMDLQNKRCY